PVLPPAPSTSLRRGKGRSAPTCTSVWRYRVISSRFHHFLRHPGQAKRRSRVQCRWRALLDPGSSLRYGRDDDKKGRSVTEFGVSDLALQEIDSTRPLRYGFNNKNNPIFGHEIAKYRGCSRSPGSTARTS